jgi:signal transduction protein with GAF and PtsI domain
MSVESELTAIVAATRGLFASAACSCALASDDGATLTFVAADGAGAAAIIGVTLPVSRGIVGYVALSGQPMAIADVAQDDRFARDIAEATDYVPTSIVAAPMLDDDGETIGVIEVLDPAHGSADSFLGGQRGTAAELAVLTVVASQAASVLRLARAAESRPDDAVWAAVDSLDDAGRAALVALVSALGRGR